MTPISKTGKSTSPFNYRLMLVFIRFSKIFKNIIKNRLNLFLSRNELLHNDLVLKKFEYNHGMFIPDTFIIITPLAPLGRIGHQQISSILLDF